MDPKNLDFSIKTISSENHIKIKIKKKSDQSNNELTLNQNIYPKIIIKIKPSIQSDQIETNSSKEIIQPINDIPIKRSRIKKWTLPLFLEKAWEIHGQKYNYTQITPENINGQKSSIIIICNICSYQWSSIIHRHINQKIGCPNCTQRVIWTLERFLIRAVEIHGSKYNYSQITSDNITNSKSRVLIICNICNYQWFCSVQSHINQKNECPGCSQKIHWTLERFIFSARKIHGNKYDYSQILFENIKNNQSPIYITCLICSYKWKSTINSHINYKHECPNCSGQARYDLKKFLLKSNKIHNNRYDYSQITADQIINSQSIVSIICRKCNHHFNLKIVYHIFHRAGCPKCNKSNGETNCQEILDKLKIEYKIEYIIPSLSKKRFDLMFNYQNNKYLLEYDGIQHFEFSPFFHKKIENFEEKQKTDILKSQKAIEEGYYLIRIDYSNEKNIEEHITNALNTLNKNNKIYYSDITKYEYIYKTLGNGNNNITTISPLKIIIRIKKY